MCDNKLASKLVDVPLARPGFDALTMSAPVLVQMNPDGKWENTKPNTLDEDRLKAVVQYLVNTKALTAAQNYCCQCAVESQKEAGGAPNNYVPVIMMPIYPADKCPFDLDCEINKMKESEAKAAKKTTGKTKETEVDDKDKSKKKAKKRGFVMQRLTNFDLLSQW